MKKVLVGLFAVLIIGFGVVGFSQMNDGPNEIVDDEKNHTMTIKS
ncbi:hypothetical protein [Virgibacillus profundi]|nr:hypothetical protein [Virgibacillus profundi]